MGKMSPFKLKEVTYTLSNFEVKIVQKLWTEFPHKTEKRIKENWASALTLLTPIVGTYAYAQKYVEDEKQHHRF